MNFKETKKSLNKSDYVNYAEYDEEKLIEFIKSLKDEEKKHLFFFVVGLFK